MKSNADHFIEIMLQIQMSNAQRKVWVDLFVEFLLVRAQGHKIRLGAHQTSKSVVWLPVPRLRIVDELGTVCEAHNNN